MVTDGILCAVQGVVDNFKTKEEKHAGEVIWNMLTDFDEDVWYEMSDKQKDEWVKSYTNKQ